jgi:hypothetical protein
MKRELRVSRMSGVDPIVTMSVEGQVTKEIHVELALFSPALVAVLGQMQATAWYDDEDHSITIKRDITAPPMHR